MALDFCESSDKEVIVSTTVYPSRPTIAQPLTADDLADLRESGMNGLIQEIGGKLYLDEDLAKCEGCDLKTVDRMDFNEDGFCEACAKDQEVEREHMRQLTSDYYRSRI